MRLMVADCFGVGLGTLLVMRNPARDCKPGFSQPGGLIAAASEVISCERSPTSTADRIQPAVRGGVPTN